MGTLRGSLSDLAQELNRLLLRTPNLSEKQHILILLNTIYRLWERVIVLQDLAREPWYDQTIQQLDEAKQEALDAIADINRTVTAINRATQVLGALENALRTVAGAVV